MSKKQLGAVPAKEPIPVESRGWFARLRGQPGFRTAAIAFVLTVVLGIGGSAAYAYWSLRTQVNMTAKTVSLPSITKPTCSTSGTTSVSWSPPAVMPVNAVYVVRITKTKRGVTASSVYALAQDLTSFKPADLDGGRFERWMDGELRDPTDARVTVSVGALASGPLTAKNTRLVQAETEILKESDPVSPEVFIRSQRLGLIPWFECPSRI